MIIFLFVQFYAWGYGVELTEHARITFLVFSLLETVTVCAIGIAGYFVSQYESYKNEVAK